MLQKKTSASIIYKTKNKKALNETSGGNALLQFARGIVVARKKEAEAATAVADFSTLMEKVKSVDHETPLAEAELECLESAHAALLRVKDTRTPPLSPSLG